MQNEKESAQSDKNEANGSICACYCVLWIHLIYCFIRPEQKGNDYVNALDSRSACRIENMSCAFHAASGKYFKAA